MSNLFKMLLVFFPFWGMFAQPVTTNMQLQESFKELPQEKVFVHFNSSLLMPGTQLYYKVYVLNTTENKLSELSKVAYVVLLNKDGKEVFKHKIYLKNGVGASDFFIPNLVNSGHYKLVAYTQWMQNEGVKNSFRANLLSINPYQNEQDIIDTEKENISFNFEDVSSENSGELLSLSLAENTYGKREKVSLEILNAEKVSGNFSVSVNKLTSFEIPEKPTSINFDSNYKTEQRQGSEFYIPELRGELLMGNISPLPGHSSRKPFIALSISGDMPLFKTSVVNNRGEFYFNLDEKFDTEEAYFQVLENENSKNENSNYEIKLKEKTKISTSAFDFPDYKISGEANEEILQRSIHHQIENAYFEAKADSLPVITAKDKEIYPGDSQLYILDNYTRFKTLKETFVEIIYLARIRKDAQGEPGFRVSGIQNSLDYGLQPLLLVDDVLVEDHAQFINYPSEKVESIEIFRNNFYLGPMVAQGLIRVKTFEKDYVETIDKLTETKIKPPQLHKNYIFQNYSNRDKFNRIPDFRYQLFWMPQIELEEKNKVIEFFTSDVTGTFEISLEGYTKDGDPTSLKKRFEVE